MASENIHEEPFEDPVVENKEYFEKESAIASKSLDVEVHEGGMQFEEDTHRNCRSLDLDGVVEEESNQELKEELPNIGLEQKASSGAEQEADSGAEQEADSGAEQEADSGAEQEADSGAEQETDSGAEQQEPNEYDEPLYPGAAITVSIAMTLLLAFIVCHKLSNEAIADLLYLIDHICPNPNRCCRTLYKFKKFFSFLAIPFNCCYYCAQCFNPISDVILRACGVCKTVINSVKDLSYFIHIPISDQIRTLFARRHFYSNLLHRFTRVKLNQDCLEDIYDGLLYRN